LKNRKISKFHIAMTGFIIGTIIIISILLVLVVLAQNPKSGGSGGGLAFSGANQLMGAKRSADVFEKMTWGFIVTIMILALVANVTLDKDGATEQFASPNVEKAKETGVTAPTTFDSAAQQAPVSVDTTKK
jgi:preprotein translocase subunit SecG